MAHSTAFNRVIVLVEYFAIHLLLLCHVHFFLLLGANLVLARVRSLNYSLASHCLILGYNRFLVNLGVLLEADGMHVWTTTVLVRLHLVKNFLRVLAARDSLILAVHY